ncbi:NAD(P)H-dependent oxidoreductase [Aureivirga sp. CE67]|uniref:NAD(P)H-dependent oxidoreductase n=1 Tax=Aureivirga sp. CE67 TaxID=1788983 RepID=UPI0018CB5C83|nr:NAD(P)H-dependent oxidoreductase [Aureivirga sp. CE67]
MNIIESLKWRAAVRNFDSSKKVSTENVNALVEAGNLTATSMGLQPFKIIVLHNEEIQKELIPYSYNQKQVGEASHVLIFAIETNVNQQTIDNYLERHIEVRNVEASSLENYKNSMSNYLSMMDEETKKTWATKQAYIALGTVMTAAADLKIDSCAMEGFDPEKYQEMLGLKEENLLPVVVLPIGYRSEEEMMAGLPKVRKALENFVIEKN